MSQLAIFNLTSSLNHRGNGRITVEMDELTIRQKAHRRQSLSRNRKKENDDIWHRQDESSGPNTSSQQASRQQKEIDNALTVAHNKLTVAHQLELARTREINAGLELRQFLLVD